MKNYNNSFTSTQNSIDIIKTFDGKVNIIQTENDNYVINNTYFTNLNMLFKLQSESLLHMNKELKAFYEHMAEACMNLEEISKTFNTLKILTEKAELSTTITTAYDNFEVFFKDWKRIGIDQTYIIKNKVNKFFKEINNTTQSFSEVLDRQEVLKNQILNNKTQ